MTSQTLQAQFPRTAKEGLPHAAAMLAYAGSLPLIVAAMLAALRQEEFGVASFGFMAIYGGVLIAFFGGVRWGIAVMRSGGPTFSHLAGSVAPLLLAIPIFVSNSVLFKLVFILAALPVLLVDDLRSTRRKCGAPEWYLGVRTPLTVLMVASYAVAVFAYLSG